MRMMRQMPYAHDAPPKYRKSTWLTLNQTPLIVVSGKETPKKKRTHLNLFWFSSLHSMSSSLTLFSHTYCVLRVRWAAGLDSLFSTRETIFAYDKECTLCLYLRPLHSLPAAFSQNKHTPNDEHNGLKKEKNVARCDQRPSDWPNALINRRQRGWECTRQAFA